MEIDEKILAESLQQEHTSTEPPGNAAAAPRTPTQPPIGRRWVKGQSGNPHGRPSRAHKAAYVAHSMFDDKTVPLMDRVMGWCQGSDRSMLRLYAQKMVPPRPEVPVWLNLPPIENCKDLVAAMRAVANGVAQGDIPSAQGLRLVRLFTELYRYL